MATFGDKARGLLERYFQSYWRPALVNFGLGTLLLADAYFISGPGARNFAFWCSGASFGYGLFQLLFPLKRAELSEIDRAHMEAQFRALFFKQFEEAKRAGWVPPDAKADFGGLQ